MSMAKVEVLMFGWLVRLPGKALRQKFISIGVVQGKTRGEIEQIAGPPNSVSATGPHSVLCQWMATGYHIALLFDKHGICQGITHEAVV